MMRYSIESRCFIRTRQEDLVRSSVMLLDDIGNLYQLVPRTSNLAGGILSWRKFGLQARLKAMQHHRFKDLRRRMDMRNGSPTFTGQRSFPQLLRGTFAAKSLGSDQFPRYS